MRHLNYNHLLYFWTVASEGSIARASEVLHLTPQTISGQLKLLEETIGEPLFLRAGRGLVLTDTGRVVSQYADEIFSLGAELTQRMRGGEPGAPVMELEDDIRIVWGEGELESLLGDLAVHKLDLVISDRAIPSGLNVKAYNHALGESTVQFFAPKHVAYRYVRSFPDCLEGGRVLLPVTGSPLRRSLEEFFDRKGVVPKVVAEFDDSALLKAFGEAGAGFFPAPAAIAEQVEHMYHAKSIGEVDGVTEHFYAISPERKIKHPAVVRITEVARERLSG